MSEPRSAEVSAHYILTIFNRHNGLKGQTLLWANLTLPFSQDGWQLADFDAGREYAVGQGWIEIGKEDRFLKLTEAGYEVAKTVPR